jgi:hypothetical protein
VQQCLQHSGLLQQRPPLQPAKSGNTHYTLAPYQVGLLQYTASTTDSLETKAPTPQGQLSQLAYRHVHCCCCFTRLVQPSSMVDWGGIPWHVLQAPTNNRASFGRQPCV